MEIYTEASPTASVPKAATNPEALGIQSVLGLSDVKRPDQFFNAVVKLSSGLQQTLTREETIELAHAFFSLYKMEPDRLMRSMQSLKNLIKKEITSQTASTVKK